MARPKPSSRKVLWHEDCSAFALSNSGKGDSSMAESTRNEAAPAGADLAAAARDRGMEQLESAKGQLAEGAERVAAAVDRTADELEGAGDSAISGVGHSVASVMRQLAGGLRERDVEEFAREVGALSRRNPGVFLAGCVALGFGIARFFKARGPAEYADRDFPADRDGRWRSSEESRPGGRGDFDGDDSLDLSEGATARELNGGDDERPRSASGTSPTSSGSSSNGTSTMQEAAARDDDSAKSRPAGGKPKVKPQRASQGGSQQPGSEGTPVPSTEGAPTGGPAVGGSAGTESAFTGGTGGGALRGGKS
jgi:hypothetical protein